MGMVQAKTRGAIRRGDPSEALPANEKDVMIFETQNEVGKKGTLVEDIEDMDAELDAEVDAVPAEEVRGAAEQPLPMSSAMRAILSTEEVRNMLAEKDAQLAESRAQLAEKNAEIASLKSRITPMDVGPLGASLYKIREVVKKLDVNGDGFMSVNEVKVLLSAVLNIPAE